MAGCQTNAAAEDGSAASDKGRPVRKQSFHVVLYYYGYHTVTAVGVGYFNCALIELQGITSHWIVDIPAQPSIWNENFQRGNRYFSLIEKSKMYLVSSWVVFLISFTPTVLYYFQSIWWYAYYGKSINLYKSHFNHWKLE